ncbi:Phospholipid-transporting ATPase [Fasciola hepatica]|uniref:Phospholipid-transporting ATPase n=1 Tax=Fasciola hepatica TaxID=6192 RepID=A0A4E0RZR0_FASHE|nr:Phospholipid-transporting ATPase [Fasciola hepatica]
MKKCLQRIGIKLGLRRPPLPPQRNIPIGPVSKAKFVSPEYSLEKLYGDNEITTSRYTWYGFFFQNLGEQAQRIANFYFICIAVVQLFTDSPVTPAISIIPLIFVFSVTMIKQGYEDWLRHKADREVNHVKVEVVTEEGLLQTVRAQKLSVGDIVLCRSNDTFPCDLLLLSTSEPNGECFVTTASLDGETNLKRFVASEQTRVFDSPDVIASELRGTITCQQPVNDLYTFNGKVNLETTDGETECFPIGPENLLLRGACLRNTDFVYACAVYTGRDTKMTLNSQGKTTKFSQVERKLNLCLALVLCFLLACALLSSILFFTQIQINSWYTPPQKTTAWIVAQTFLGFIVLYNYIIPISLYVTIEVQKFFGSLFFEWDITLYDSNANERAKANTSDLIEEMGQVEYLFSDKTGTLTENCMRFRRFATSIGSFCLKDKKIYSVIDEPQRRRSSCLEPEPQLGDSIDFTLSTNSSSMYSDSSSVLGARQPSERSITLSSINNLMMVLALCHTVRVERSLPGQEKNSKPRPGTPLMMDALTAEYRDPPKRGSSALRRASAAQAASAAVRASRRGQRYKLADYIYQASSPDEKAFVEASRDMGIVYHGEDESGMQVVTLHGFALRYRLLAVLEFDPTRKCMTVVLRPVRAATYDAADTPILVLCKGAETAMLPKIRSPTSPGFGVPEDFRDPLCVGLSRTGQPGVGMSGKQVIDRVTEFANSGLRTLVIGAKLITSVEWSHLKSELDDARGMLEGREQALNRIYGKIEQEFMLIGCTGVEDMLQDGVPETIEALREAGIQVWILTGDKEETAVNISYSAGHFFPGINEARITKQENFSQCSQVIDCQIERIQVAKSQDPESSFGLVIDGQSLNYALEIPLREKFTQCCLSATTVLCCRLTPLQKAEVVRMIKECRSPPPVTAAIGDGANDVSMILEAHVSFGLFGKEGRQAVRAADYAFSRFRFLKTAILFHGHIYYIRVAMLVLYFFYKNLVFTLPQMLFGFFCAYSAQSIYPEFYLVFFNITMTSIPIFLFGLFEKPIPRDILLTFPSLYRSNVRNRGLSRFNFLIWISLAVWHAFVIFFGVYFMAFRGQAGGGSNAQTGYGGSAVGEIVCFGNLILMLIFFVVNLRMLFFSYFINWVVGLGFAITIIFNLAMFLFLNFYLFPMETGAQLYGTYSVLWGGSGLGTGWFSIIVLVFLALSPDFILRALSDQGWQWRLEALRYEEEERALQEKTLCQTKPKTRPTKLEEQVTRSSRRTDTVDEMDESQLAKEANSYTNPTFDWSNGEANESVSQPHVIPRKARLHIEELFEHGPIEPAPEVRSNRLLNYVQAPPTQPMGAASQTERERRGRLSSHVSFGQPDTTISRM